MWFLRAIQLDEREWACRHGLTEFDTHAELHHALEHLRALAEDCQPAQLFIHRLDGTVENLG